MITLLTVVAALHSLSGAIWNWLFFTLLSSSCASCGEGTIYLWLIWIWKDAQCGGLIYLNRIQDFISFWLSLETPKIYSIIYLKKIHIWNLLSPLVLAHSSASKCFPSRLALLSHVPFWPPHQTVYELQECRVEDLLSLFVAEEQDMKQWVDCAKNKLSLPPSFFFHLSLSFSSSLLLSLPPSPIPNGSVVYRAL